MTDQNNCLFDNDGYCENCNSWYQHNNCQIKRLHHQSEEGERYLKLAKQRARFRQSEIDASKGKNK